MLIRNIFAYSILREEGDTDVWTRRPWSMPGSGDEDEGDESSDDLDSDDSDMSGMAFSLPFMT